MMRYVFGLAFIVVCFVSCAPTFSEITDPSKRLNNVSGVSVLPPQAPGWNIGPMTQSQLWLAKRGQPDGESYAATVISFNMPSLDTEQEFLKWFLELRASEPQDDRYTNVKDETNLVHGRGAVCVRIHEVRGDNAAQIGGTETKVMVLEGIIYLCQHPKNKRIGVRMDYSHRHFAGNDDPAMETKANAFLDQVQFTDF
ncbi:MAG: hypothetical protein JW395_1009 [Nitrospira sp.]|nr:hypothetical protein [Nitrospira sp.]